jgi:pimeloyl-ACP methyl ester carboxylesterase
MTAMSSLIGGRRLEYWRSAAPPRAGLGPDRRAAAPGVLLLHGLGADHQGLLSLTRTWPDAQLIAPDLPGFGRSDPLDLPHSLVNYAHTMDALCGYLRLSRLVVIGHSLGANIALALARAHPHRVRALVLISPVVMTRRPHAWLARAYYGVGGLLPTRAARPWLLSRAAVYLGDRSMFVTRDRRVRRRILREDYRTAALADPRAVTEACRGIHETPLPTLAGAVRAPTVLIAGERDGLASPDALIALHNRLPVSELVLVPGAGHLWVVEDAERAAGVIVASLRRLTDRRGAAAGAAEQAR